MAEAANVLGEVEPVQPPKDVSFAVGDTFESFDALVTKIKPMNKLSCSVLEA